MKMPRLLPEKKLKATARRVPQKVMEYEEEEPAMKFSSAFIVVLLLHVTAFGGIWAFNNIKAHRAAPIDNVTKPSVVQSDLAAPTAIVKEDVTTPTAQTTTVANSTSVAKASLPPAAKPEESTASKHETVAQSSPHVADSGVVYTAVKGDNPVTIAHHFGVSYDELLKLNNIENPKKLQIGQKLHIPVKQKN